MHQPHFTPQKHYYFYVSGTHFCYRLSKPQGLVQPEGLRKFKNSPHPVLNLRPSGLKHSALTTTLPRAPLVCSNWLNMNGDKPYSKINICN
jgi:hypothetical protein